MMSDQEFLSEAGITPPPIPKDYMHWFRHKWTIWDPPVLVMGYGVFQWRRCSTCNVHNYREIHGIL